MIWGQEFLLDRAQHLQSDSVQLYDIAKDPEERNNIAHLNEEVHKMVNLVQLIYSMSIFVGDHVIEETIVEFKERFCSSNCCAK